MISLSSASKYAVELRGGIIAAGARPSGLGLLQGQRDIVTWDIFTSAFIRVFRTSTLNVSFSGKRGAQHAIYKEEDTAEWAVTTEEHHMKTLFLVPKMTEGKKTWAWAIAVLILLAIIVVGATLIGVYMTQKHIEEVVQMAFEAKNGEKIQQTVMVNDEENVAAFYVNSNNISSTVLYDYNHDIIGFRRINNPKCLVVEMNDVSIPSMSDVLRVIKHFQQQNATSDSDLSYDLVEGEEADRTTLGVPINILCSDVPIHWATQNKSPRLRWKITLRFSIFGIDVAFTYES
ncbi:uncharacterized protein LOC143764173 isoform X2 [Ranitomeya variabilis]|uniref:uncharacterized protein LOC143764173 isoform X2 n=2 Tax=Ranitomeya variabilis TaxID=490064 RepID=UPI004056F96E